MPGSKVLVLGATGPAGICLLRELVFRKHPTVVYARNPGKIPEKLASDPLVEIIHGEMHDRAALSPAIAQSKLIISLLGPNTIYANIDRALFAGYYKDSIFPLMREHGVRRILAMGTPSIARPDDHWTFIRPLLVSVLRVLANNAYRNMLNIADAFDFDAGDTIDWTVFRIAAIPGNADHASWEADRGDGEVFVGWIGESGWSFSQRRAALARWLVDVAEDEHAGPQWIGKMPAVSRLAGSDRRADD